MAETHKLLCIGASTYNVGTPDSIREALAVSSLLKNGWTVIVCIHKYLRIYEMNYEDQRQARYREFEGLPLVLTDISKTYPVSPGHIYILPDSSPIGSGIPYEIELAHTQNQTLEIHVYPVNQFNNECDLGFDSFTSYESGVAEYYLPEIDSTLKQLASLTNEVAQVAAIIMAGKGNDGSEGLLLIKQAGGKTAVQDPKECSRDGAKFCTSEMPSNALIYASKYGQEHDLLSLLESPDSNTNRLVDWLSRL